MSIEIIVILDRSGSMGSVASDAIGGFNTFLEKEKKDSPDSKLTLVFFDDIYEIVHNGISISQVAPLTSETFLPRGCTALYDAIGRTIDDVGKRLHETREADRPAKVLVAILTDGLENASRKFVSKQIQEMIKHQSEAYRWEFVFLAANQDAIATGETIGITRAASINMMHTGAGHRAFGNTLHTYSMAVKGGQQVNSICGQSVYTSSLMEEQEKEE